MVNVGYALIAQVVVNPPTTRSRPRHPLMLSLFKRSFCTETMIYYKYIIMLKCT
jgi:hypothetical protein